MRVSKWKLPSLIISIVLVSVGCSKFQATGQDSLASKDAIHILSSCRHHSAPLAPSGLAGTPAISSVSLQWNLSTSSDVTTYRISRNGVQIASLSAPATSYNDSGLAASTAFQYSVYAVDSCNKVSTPASISVSTLASTVNPPPAAPGNLAAGWLYTNGNKIYQSNGSGGGTQWMGRGTNMDDVFLCGYNENFVSNNTNPDVVDINIGKLISGTWKANFIRVSLSMYSFGTAYTWNVSGQTPSQYQSYMTNVINTLATGNTYVLVTLRSHSTMVESNPGNEATYIPTINTDSTYRGLVDSFAANKNVIFALTNEPTGAMTSIAPAMIHAVATIRAEESKLGVNNHLISVQSTNYTSDLSYFAANPISSTNIVYEYHGYPPVASAYTYSNIPVIIGEYGSSSSGSTLASSIYADFEAKQIPNLAWDFDPYNNCAPDLVNVTYSTTSSSATTWGAQVQRYLANPLGYGN
jgi:hypothetical protein